MSGGKRGKLFFRKVFPVPLSKDFKQEIGIWLPRGFTVAEVCAGFVRSAFGDPDLRSPSGFDFGLRPSLRMTRGAGIGAQSLDLRRICWTFGVVF